MKAGKGHVSRDTRVLDLDIGGRWSASSSGHFIYGEKVGFDGVVMRETLRTHRLENLKYYLTEKTLSQPGI
jgi:hypothetical protein